MQADSIHSLNRSAALLAVMIAASSTARADDYAEKVEPILAEHCYDCHGEDKRKSNLRLDLPEGILRGGDSGEPFVVSGSSEASYLISRITDADPEHRMPPKGKGLSEGEVAVLRSWIDKGAKLPGLTADASTVTTDHWSFQPVVRPESPKIADAFVKGSIDAFILEKLRANKLSPSGTTDRRTLIRRLYLVMHGLPPTPEEVGAFVKDRGKGAYARLVDRVLKSPRYGERWGRHWLDVARYADTNGFETNRERKTAYHYRDYVIQAFNEDRPYNQFIVDQIAGDVSGEDAATGFLVAGPYDIVKSPDISLTLAQRQDELADMVNTTGTAFLGLTIGCARCHNHKFDPVLQKDYYSMQAVFAGVEHGERTLPVPEDKSKAARLEELRARQVTTQAALESLKQLAAPQRNGPSQKKLRPAVNSRENIEMFDPINAKFVRFTVRASSSSQPCIDELEIYNGADKNIALATHGTKPSASGTLPGYEIHKLEHINDGRTGNTRSWISNATGGGWVQLEFAAVESVQKIVWGRDRSGQFQDRLATDYVIEASHDGINWKAVASSDDREPFSGASDPTAFVKHLAKADAGKARLLLDEENRLQQEIDGLENGPLAWAGNFKQPSSTHRLYRGDPMQKREIVAPDALTVLGSLSMATDEPEQQRRLKLARWIAGKDNPLTARVMVNRIWHYIFGTGIAETPSDLGVNGIPPSHPELLDWLADEFMRSGWSVKHMQRLILLSNTFQQSSAPRKDAAEVDAASRLLWRFPPRRLEAEAIRDNILAVSGALQLTGGGPGFYLHRVQVENVMHYFPKHEFGPSEFRRMVYLFKIRQEQDSIFGSFDCPDGNQVIPKRSRSNTPLQALNLFNSPFVLQQAGILSERLAEHRANEAKVKRAFQLAFAREPDAFELEVSVGMIEAEGVEAFCRALFNTSEFLFVF